MKFGTQFSDPWHAMTSLTGGGLPMSLARTTRSRRSSRSLMRTMMVRSAQIHSTYRHGKIISSGVEICSWHGMTWHDMQVEEFQYLPREEVSVDPNNFSKNKSEFWKVSSPWLILVLRSVVFFHFFPIRIIISDFIISLISLRLHLHGWDVQVSHICLQGCPDTSLPASPAGQP